MLRTAKNGTEPKERGRPPCRVSHPGRCWWGWVEYRKAAAAREATRGVRGRVVDVLGDPVRGCAVTVEDRGTRKVARTTTTRRDGTFEFEFWPGELSGLVVVARAEGCAPTEGELPTPRKDFALMPDLLAMPGGPLRGRLVGDDGRPRAGVTLRMATRPIMWLASPGDLQVVTADDGAFVVPDLVEAGWWFVAADGVRIQPFGMLVVPGVDEIVNLVASEQAIDAAIHGRIIDDQGEAVPGVECRATVMVEEELREPIAVDAEGRFVLEHFAGTPRGPVTLRAKCPGYRDAELSGLQWGARDVELVLRRAPRVRVHVVDAAGAPVPGVSVCIGWGEYVDPESASKTDEEGIDVLPAESPGLQTVRLNWPDVLREAALVELDLADGPPREAVLEVAEGQRCQVLVRWESGVASSRATGSCASTTSIGSIAAGGSGPSRSRC